MTYSSLPYPVNFIVTKSERWPELFEESKSLISDPSPLYNRLQNNEDCWVVLTYLYLKRKNLNVFVSDHFVPGEICVVSSLDFGISDFTFNSFVVGCRGDGFKPELCDFTIVMTKPNLTSSTDIVITHWPQPGLIQRSKDRGNTIENVVFKGHDENLYTSFRSDEFKQELNKLGVELIINSKPVNGRMMWDDFSHDDLILAVRDLTEKDALMKPANKLINAWIAGVPALLGPEPAYQDLRRSELDYIEVKTPESVLEAIRKLKAEPETYQKMVANGLQRAQDFTVEKITEQWCQALSGPIAETYRQWKGRNQIIRAARFVPRVIGHKAAVRKADYNRMHGYRIISGQYT